jgi:Carboxypeptidase regulatory-like domain
MGQLEVGALWSQSLAMKRQAHGLMDTSEETQMTNSALVVTNSHGKRNIVFLVIAAVITALCCSSTALAQSQSGLSTIQGTVTDSTGAVIRGATVHIVNNATAVATDAKSNGVGFFQAPGLVAGAYTVRVEAPNMKTYLYALNLLATQTAVVNPVLSTGAVTQQVTVSGSMVQLTDTSDGAITSTLDNEQINHIPMNGRNTAALAMFTTPGLEYGFGQATGQGSLPGTRMNGLVGEAMEYDEDGAPTENRDFGGPNSTGQVQYQDPDSVQEVRVEASGGGAQYSSPGTAIVTTKSGTNELHGTAFWTGRNNSAAGIARARNNPSNFAVPNLKRNEFGVSAGGPVIIPGLYHGKEKTFWFVAFEKYDDIYTSNVLAATETTGMVNGDFSGLATEQLYDPSTTTANAACPTPGVVNGKTIWNAGPTVNNPYCRTPFGNGIMGDPGNNQIPAGRRNGLSKVVYDGQIPPNISGVTNPKQAANENWASPNFFFVPTVTWRLDQDFNEYNKAYLRYTDSLQNAQYYGSYLGTVAADGIPALAIGSETIAPIDNFAAAAGYTHIFSPTFFSETILSASWFRDIGSATGDPKHNYASQLGLPDAWGEAGMPAFGGSIQSHNGNEFGYGISDNIWNLDENLTKTLSKHQLLFGARIRHEFLNYAPDISGDSESADALATGLYQTTTGTSYGAVANTGDSAADFFLGAVATTSTNLYENLVHFADEEFDAYIQDNYHVSRSLTVNLGIRYEDRPAMSTGGIAAGIDLVHHAMVLKESPGYYIANGRTTQAIINAYQNAGAVFETPAAAGMPSRMLRDYPFNIDPHLGFAWQPLGTRRGTVIRGSYGRYTYPEAVRNLLGLARAAPFIQGFSYNNNLTSQDPDGIPNYEIRHPQNIFMGQNTSSSLVPTTGTNSILPGTFGGGFNPDFPPTIAQEVDVSVEQAFKDQSALRVTYNYTHASNVTHEFIPNETLSNFVWAYDTGTTPPTGGASAIGTCQYSTTALEPWDCKTFGAVGYQDRSGWSTDNSLQVNYQRLFHHGLAYQFMYVWSRPFRIGGNSTRDSLTYPLADYPGVMGTAAGVSYAPPAGGSPITAPAIPPAAPAGAQEYTDYKALTRFEDYKVEPYFSATYLHHIIWNAIYDLPMGRGKWLLGRSNRFVDELVGGWEIAGVGQVESQGFAPGASNWGPTSPLKLYKHNVPITDCSSGKCFKRYMWFNGYISPKFLPPGNGGICTSNCVTGLPSTYLPYETPINNNPSCPTCAANFGNNNVVITGPNLGTNGYTTAFSPGYAGNNLYSRSYFHGPFNYEADLSVFKVFPINEKMNFRVNVDAFNAFNIQGYTNPNATNGEEDVQPGGVDGTTSYWAPRQLQLTMRFTF